MPRRTPIGRRRSKITIQRATQTRSTNGGFSETWTKLATRWSEVVQLSEGERTQGDAMQSIGRFEFAFPVLSGMTTRDRILYGTRVFNPISVDANEEDRNRQTVVVALEVDG